MNEIVKRKRKEGYYRCKYCGAILKRDCVGQYCPTDNCDWSQGLPEDEDWPGNDPKDSGD